MSLNKDKYNAVVDSIRGILSTLASPPRSLAGEDIVTFLGKFDVEDATEVVLEKTASDNTTEYRLQDSHLLHRKSGPAMINADGHEFWYQYGNLHRTDGPALVTDHSKMYFKTGVLHRTDGPAVEMLIPDTNIKYTCWCENGVPHRDGAPALEFDDGTSVYIQNGHIHRTDGPAITLPGGTSIWVQHGRIHREDGPAVINGDETLYYHRGRASEQPKTIFSRGISADGQNRASIAHFMATRLEATVVHDDERGYCLQDLQGNRFWYVAGTTIKHRDDGPAIELTDGTKIYYKNGAMHREDGPAFIKPGGEEYCYVDGKLHSLNSATPAVKLPCGTQIFFKNGVWHRDGDLPAAILVENNGDHTVIWARNGKLHRDELGLPAVKWGGGDGLEQSTHHLLKSVPCPDNKFFYKIKTYNVKPVNQYEFYREGIKIAETPQNSADMMSMRMLSLGGMTVSATGTAVLRGELTPLGIADAEITGGTLKIKSTRDVELANCIIRDATIFIEVEDNSQISVIGNYLVNSKIFYLKGIASNNLIDDRSAIRDAAEDDGGTGESVAASVRRMHERAVREEALRSATTHTAAHNSEAPFFTAEEVEEAMEQLEMQFKVDHLSPEEQEARVKQLLKESMSRYIGNDIKHIDIDSVKKRIENILKDLDNEPDVKVERDSEDPGVLRVSLQGTPAIPIQYAFVLDANEVTEQDEAVANTDDSSSWVTAIGALGIAALVSYLSGAAKPSSAKKQEVRNREVTHAAL
jgi:hypothetical protein